MTYAELKAEAKRQGYALVKHNPRPQKLTCKCGSNRRQTWYSPYGIYLKCCRCGMSGKAGKSEREAIENWNRKVAEE